MMHTGGDFRRDALCRELAIGRFVRMVILGVILLVGFPPISNLPTSAADEPVFSGPQVGEPITPFKIRGLFRDADTELDLVAATGNDPLVLVFVHEVTRPSIAVARLVAEYASRQSEDGLHTGVVWLTDDPTEAEAFARRAQHALPQNVPMGIFTAGLEGPGAYGLNRQVTLTILVAKDQKVAANFALVQPSVAVDVPKIGAAIAEVLGRERPPTLAEMAPGQAERMETAQRMDAVDDDRFRALMGPVIRKTATPQEVTAAAQAVEEAAAENKALRQRIGDVARRIIDAGRLESYGTETAQEFLTKWAAEFKAAEQADDEPQR